MAQPLDSIEGTISRTNERGLQLTGRDGWLNILRFAKPEPAIPPAGTRVRVGLDSQGFIRAIGVVAAGAFAVCVGAGR